MGFGCGRGCRRPVGECEGPLQAQGCEGIHDFLSPAGFCARFAMRMRSWTTDAAAGPRILNASGEDSRLWHLQDFREQSPYELVGQALVN